MTTTKSDAEEFELPAYSLPASTLRPRPAGIRILAPGGKVGYVPADQLEAALAAGALVLTAEKMKEMRQAIFMEHQLHESKKPKPMPARHKRKSLWKGGKR